MTVDHASHGRFDLGLGAAWAQREHDELGIEFPPIGERFDLLEDTLEIITRLFTGERVSYAGHRVSLTNAQLRPLPVQTPRPPIWIGGTGPKRTLPLIARYADYWHMHRPRRLPAARRPTRRAGRRGGTRSRRHQASRLAVAVGAVAGGSSRRRGGGRPRLRLPDLRLARAGFGAGDRVRRDGPAGLRGVGVAMRKLGRRRTHNWSPTTGIRAADRRT